MFLLLRVRRGRAGFPTLLRFNATGDFVAPASEKSETEAFQVGARGESKSAHSNWYGGRLSPNSLDFQNHVTGPGGFL